MDSLHPILVITAAAILLFSLAYLLFRWRQPTTVIKNNPLATWIGKPAEHKRAGSPVCDMCSRRIDLAEAYFATSEQVVTRPTYWEAVFSAQWDYVHQMDPRGKLIGKLAEHQANISTTWALCEDCCHKLEIDHQQARAYALAKINPIPGSGPADTSRTAAAASAAWMKLYGAFPVSIKFE